MDAYPRSIHVSTVVVRSGTATWALDPGPRGVALVGAMPAGVLALAWSTTLAWHDWTALVPSAAGVAVLAFLRCDGDG